MTTQASVIRYEQAVANKDFETACNELLSILSKLDSNFGDTHDIECDYPVQLTHSKDECTVHFCTRVAVATTALFDGQNDFGLSDSGFSRFMTLHRWLGLIFAASSYVNADHILATYNVNPSKDINNFHLPDNLNVWKKFCVLYTGESNIPLSLDALWGSSPELCGSLCFALQSPRFIGTEAAFNKRANILRWFPAKLATFEDLSDLPSAISHDVYMHCSYDVDVDKHRVKESLNQVIRKHLLKLDWQDRDVGQIGEKNGKPVMLVVLEHFHNAHSIYRTHSTSMVAAREHFYLVGIGGSAVDEAGRQVFDEFHEIGTSSTVGNLIEIKKIADELQPAVLYMPSIGMDLTTIFLSNTQIAPVQAIALGHPATTHSPFIDYVIVEDDYVGSEDCFSEKLIRLPKDALPYVPSALAPSSVEYRLRQNPEVVNIGVASTTMKLNPYFLQACQAIRDRAKVKVHFHFALGQSSGVTHPYVTRFIKTYLGDDATAHAHSPYHNYLRILHQCDMMINPFPFGNTNGIIDMVTLGLVGVCKTGPEVHEHIDEGLFQRLGLPMDKLVTKTVDEYVERTIELIENHEERLELRRHIIENNGLATLFTGNPKPMGEQLLAKVKERGLLGGTPAKKTTRKTGSKTAKKADGKATKKPTKKLADTATAAKKPATRRKTTKTAKTDKA
ncbi:hypothetical protein ACFBZI_04985 [Moraxella sp. ZJ142]|uniref:UDP-glucose:protein N-beta-glucosyltransferase n=1 Tax=Moraxella marmotae TaxID=3344520 RepID=UPI0035D4B25E